MALAQASSVDANIHPLEIATIQQIMRRETGLNLTEAEIRCVSRSNAYESANLCKCLRRLQGQLDAGSKTAIQQALVDVIRSDATVNVLEIDYFNQAVEALRMTPAEQIGLRA